MSYWFHVDTGSKTGLQNTINFSTWAGQLQTTVIALLAVLHVPISKIKEMVQLIIQWYFKTHLQLQSNVLCFTQISLKSLYKEAKI